MKSRSLSIIAAATILAVVGGCGSSKTLATSEWRTQAVVVDGKADEWQQPLRYANSATGLSYSISNDDQKLYFCFATSDGRTLAKIMRGGLQMQIQAPGMQPATLLYPIPGTVKPEKGKEQDQGKKREPGDFKLAEHATSLQVSGFPFAQTATELPLLNKFGVTVATEFGKDRFIYEAAIPLEGLNSKDKDLAVTITLKGIPKSEMKSSGSGMQSGGGMPGPGGRMGGGYGGYGGGYGGGYNNVNFNSYNSAYASMFSDQKVSLSMRLAVQQP